MKHYLFEALLYALIALGILMISDGSAPLLAAALPTVIVAPLVWLKWRRRRRGGEQTDEDETPASPYEQRRGLRATAAAFGMMGLFGLSDFMGSWLRDSLNHKAYLDGFLALLFVIAAAVFWRDSRRVLPAEQATQERV